jgi:signal transduction histidine kinase
MNVNVAAGGKIGRWTLQSPIGAGAFGLVWTAQRDDGRQGVLKMLTEAPGQELRALARICHPAVPMVLDAAALPVPFIAMEQAEGRPLARLLRAGPAPEARALAITTILADALAVVHDAGLAHGDIKPDNIIVGSIAEGIVSLIDFGLAGSAQGGTLRYASPERLSGGPPSAKADVYALGIILYEMLHGQIPWEDQGTSASLLQRASQTVSITRASPWAAELLGRMLAIDPSQRPDAAVLADDLALQGNRVPRPSPLVLERRLAATHIPLPGVDAAIEPWPERGGTLVIQAAPGTGATHQLDRIALELGARGRSSLRLAAHTAPWESVRLALADPNLPGEPLPLPLDPDPTDRAEAAATLLEGRAADRLTVIVDDVDALDVGGLGLLLTLARRGRFDLAVAGRVPPELLGTPLVLPLWGEAELLALMQGMLGAVGDVRTVLPRLVGLAGGQPAELCRLLLWALRGEAIVCRARRWVVDLAALERLVALGLPRGELELILSPAATRTAGVLALAGRPLSVEELAQACALPGEVILAHTRELRAASITRAEGERHRIATASLARRLAQELREPQAVHRRLYALEAATPSPSPSRLGWSLIGAGAVDLIAAHGADLVRATLLEDAAEAARLADALWEQQPGPALANQRLRAQWRAGLSAQALGEAEAWLQRHRPGPDQAELLIGVAAVMGDLNRPEEDILQRLAQARALLSGRPQPLELLVVEARTHFRFGRYVEALRVTEQAGPHPSARQADELDHWLTLRGIAAQALHKTGDLAGAIRAIDRVPSELGAGRPSHALLLGMRGRLLWHDGRYQEAAEVLERAAAPGSGLSLLDRARNMNNAGIASYKASDRGKALERWESALLLFEQLGARVEQIQVSNNLCVGYCESNRVERSRQVGEWAVAEAARLGHPELQAMSAGNLGDLCVVQGDYSGADRWFGLASDLAQAHTLDGERVELARRRANVALLRYSGEANELCERALALARAHGSPADLGRARALCAIAQARDGLLGELEGALSESMRSLKESGASADLAEVRVLWAEALLESGRVREAQIEADRVAYFAAEVNHIPLRSRATHLLRRVAGRRGADSGDQRLTHLLHLVVSVNRERNLGRLLHTIAEAALDLLQSDRAFVVRLKGEELEVIAAVTRDGVEAGQPSSSIVRRALEQRAEVIAADLGERGDLRAAVSVMEMKLRCAMCVPLIEGAEVLGAIYIDSGRVNEKQLSESARFMQALAAHAAIAIVNARHIEDLAQQAERNAELAHDLKSPVAGVITIARDLLRTGPLSQETREAVRDLYTLGTRAIDLADGIIQNGAREAQSLDLGTLLTEQGRVLEREARSRGLSLVLDVEPDLQVRGRPEDLVRVLRNLVGNALKYSPPGGAVIVQGWRDRTLVRISVSDQGRGIPAEELGRIFDRGYQAPGHQPGHGLGLAIVARLVREHGGTVHAENLPHGGARFLVELPGPLPQPAHGETQAA